MDGDGICDLMDDDMDGDGIPNDDELGLPIDTSSTNPDTDGDGVCDGPEAPANGGCVAGPDAFPLDPAGAKDTDGDGKPDQLVPGVPSTSQPPLVEDLDDDDDTWSDADELACGTSSTVDAASVPADTDGDGICDALDPYLDLPFTLEYPTQYVDLFVNRTMEPLIPFINGSGDVTWELEGELPEGLTFGWSPARDAALDGSIRGTPRERQRHGEPDRVGEQLGLQRIVRPFVDRVQRLGQRQFARPVARRLRGQSDRRHRRRQRRSSPTQESDLRFRPHGRRFRHGDVALRMSGKRW